MLTIKIDNPKIEKSIQQTFGDDQQSIAKAFYKFVQQQRLKQDIDISIEQFDNGQGVSIKEAMNQIRSKYE